MEERETLARGLARGLTCAQLARALGRTQSVVSREIQRNQAADGVYRAHEAEARAVARRQYAGRPSQFRQRWLRRRVRYGLRVQRWSPEQIAGHLQMAYPDQPERWISHEALYQFLVAEARAGRDYRRYLRRVGRRRRYGQRGKYERIRNARSIDQRPQVVAAKRRVGDWEADSLRGPQKSDVGLAVFAERKTQYVVAAKITDRTAATFNRASLRAFRRQAQLPVRTVTSDNGMEFGEHQTLARHLGGRVYFAHPYHAWERGLVEQINGLLREFFPQGRELTGVHPRELQRVCRLLNRRPRKTLGYRTPEEMLRHYGRC